MHDYLPFPSVYNMVTSYFLGTSLLKVTITIITKPNRYYMHGKINNYYQAEKGGVVVNATQKEFEMVARLAMVCITNERDTGA